MVIKRDVGWWKSVVDGVAFGLSDEDDEDVEFKSWLVGLASPSDRDEAELFAEIIRQAVLESVPFPICLEVRPHFTDEGAFVLIISAVDKDSLISLTANPEYGTVSVGYDAFMVSDLDGLNNLLSEIVGDLQSAYNQLVKPNL